MPLSDKPQGAGAGMSLELAISPAGRMHLEHLPGNPDLDPAAQARIERAYAQGDGPGLLHLGAVELTTWLPPSLAFGRELAQGFMARLCAAPGLAERWETVEPDMPAAELERLLAAAPPMTGAEYLDAARLQALLDGLLATARAAIAAHDGDVQAWLRRQHPGWHMVGRVCFHLAENRANEQAPFAFLATYVGQVSQQAGARHQPLGRALQEYAGAGNRDMLLGLLLPVNRAAENSPWLRSLVDSGAVFRPLAWTPAEAHQFLRNIPVFEAAGIVVRVPDWWKPQAPPRPQVKVNIGKNASGIGMDAMLDFDVSLSLDGEALSDDEWRQLMAAGDGLVRLKGRWVELDRNKLDRVLAHWKKVQSASAGDGISFLEGMRLLAGANLAAGGEAELPDSVADWSSVVAGDWMETVLEGLRKPQGDAEPGPAFHASLRPYQQDGLRWLWWLNRLGLGACLADDMGLGKTVQVLALLSLAKREGDAGPHLLVLPASLIGNWQAEIARFAPGLRVLVAHASAMPARDLATLGGDGLSGVDLVITSYGSLIRLPWLLETRWSMVVLDEAQAIKNPGARQTRAAKALHSRVRLALTGTPVENRLGELWSLFDFICPGLLGTGAAFTRFVRRLEKQDHPDYGPLRRLVQPYILRRLKSDRRIIADLPDKTEVKAYCGLSHAQAKLYGQAVDALAAQIGGLDGIARRGAVLAFLLRFKQICNHPSLWLGDGGYAPEDSGKFARLRALAEEIAARQQKLLVFTQFQEMTAPLAGFLQTVFGRPGLVLHGGTPVKSRKALVDRFQDDEGPPFFVLSIKAGGTGLNLTAASHVIHFDRWWNPAVENQATDRAYRIGQKKNVLVHKFICRGTVEERIDAMIEDKLGLSNTILADGGEMPLTEMSNEALLQMVKLDINSALDEQ
ncbi:DEAD/DEAH box helicase [Noviherbaspirillum suwonense]|uniref:Non-specific serine/threonine protein kinase n=1 Tax=Noviherbaspirillum suwonense TaxID=1224511 RepID=A0ABY1PSJ9_9BURK|nr:DEAD/DEAH box helicase [Noviherbaspirillum suwonense]SMP45798.1 non-specific serine/threonine protein kinase [Noviherbaspirillum suwonense]